MPEPLPPRAKAFADWLQSVPATPPFHLRPEFRFFADLTDAEFMAAQAEMDRRAKAFAAEANDLREVVRERTNGGRDD